MRIAHAAYWVQKHGNQPTEYEDAYAPVGEVVTYGAEFRCAIADGATETSFSGLWAQILTQGYTAGRLARQWREETRALAAEWHSRIEEQTRAKPLPWYAEEKLRRGAFSSIVGLRFRDNGQWNGICVGDSCAIQMRNGQVQKSIPYTSPEQFTNTPALLSSIPASNSGIQPTFPRGTWQAGDTFLLMTDALAQSFLSDEAVRAFVGAAFTADAFIDFIQTLRDEKRCRNDDVTLLKVHLVPGGESSGVAEPE